MIDLIYDIYSVSIKGKTRKEILKLIKHENLSYILLGKDRVSFSRSKGVSFPDLLISKINKPSFIFVKNVEKFKSYLMIYISEEIVFSGVVNNNEIEKKLEINRSKINDKLHYFTEGYSVQFNFLAVRKEITTPTKKSELSPYQLMDISSLRNRLSGPTKYIVFFSIILVLVVAASLAFHEYNLHKKALAYQRLAHRIIDVWKNYRQELSGELFSNRVTQIFNAIEPVLQLPDTSIKSLQYKQKELTINLYNFGYPAVYLQGWAKSNHFNLVDITENGIKLSKFISTQKSKYPFTIMSAKSVKAWLIDQINQRKNFMRVIFTGDKLHGNYQVISGQIDFSGSSISGFKMLLTRMSNLPLKLTAMSGSITLDSFTGNIEFNIIGGLS